MAGMTKYHAEITATADGYVKTMNLVAAKEKAVRQSFFDTSAATKSMARSFDYVKGAIMGYVGIQGIEAIGHKFMAAQESLAETFKQSKMFGMTATEYRSWDFAAQQLQGNVEEVGQSFKFLSKNMQDLDSPKIADGLRMIGLTAKDMVGKGLTEQWLTLAGGMQKTENAEKRLAAARALLGRSGTDVVPMMLNGPDEIRRALSEAGMIIPKSFEDMTRQGEEFEKEVKRIKFELHSSWEEIVYRLGPAVLAVLQSGQKTPLAPLAKASLQSRMEEYLGKPLDVGDVREKDKTLDYPDFVIKEAKKDNPSYVQKTVENKGKLYIGFMKAGLANIVDWGKEAIAKFRMPTIDDISSGLSQAVDSWKLIDSLRTEEEKFTRSDAGKKLFDSIDKLGLDAEATKAMKQRLAQEALKLRDAARKPKDVYDQELERQKLFHSMGVSSETEYQQSLKSAREKYQQAEMTRYDETHKKRSALFGIEGGETAVQKYDETMNRLKFIWDTFSGDMGISEQEYLGASKTAWEKYETEVVSEYARLHRSRLELLGFSDLELPQDKLKAALDKLKWFYDQEGLTRDEYERGAQKARQSYASEWSSHYDEMNKSPSDMLGLGDIETPLEKYQRDVAKVDAAFANGMINADQYGRHQQKLWEDLNGAAESYSRTLQEITGQGKSGGSVSDIYAGRAAGVRRAMRGAGNPVDEDWTSGTIIKPTQISSVPIQWNTGDQMQQPWTNGRAGMGEVPGQNSRKADIQIELLHRIALNTAGTNAGVVN